MSAGKIVERVPSPPEITKEEWGRASRMSQAMGMALIGTASLQETADNLATAGIAPCRAKRMVYVVVAQATAIATASMAKAIGLSREKFLENLAQEWDSCQVTVIATGEGEPS